VVMFTFIETPNGIYAYVVSVLLVLCTVMENVTTDCLLLRNAEREIRGVLLGVSNSCGYIGVLIFSLVGGILFDKVGPYWPFIFVGCLDLAFAIFTTICSLFGVIKNDILEKEVRRRLDLIDR
jgi:MFS family permease